VTRVVIVGAGGHATVVADILLRMRDSGAAVEPVACLDDDPSRHGTELLGVVVQGPLDRLAAIAHEAVIVAIGDNRVRSGLFARLRAQGERFASAIHPSAVLAPDVRLGEGIMVCAGVVVNAATEVGDDVILNTGSTIDHHNRIGAHAHIAPGTHLGGEVSVGEGALLGIGVSVLPGRSIGAWTVVGAGGVVTRDVPAQVTAVGVPARVIRTR
jgi:sugar O-acyltransferase (sialic acid O-acetyltransferase NeuD family)